jgi:hypothetical protein
MSHQGLKFDVFSPKKLLKIMRGRMFKCDLKLLCGNVFFIKCDISVTRKEKRPRVFTLSR